MKRRGLILALLFVVGFIGTALGVVYLRFVNLPHPKSASHNQLMYWVVLRDLKEYEPDVHLALVDRFAEEAKQIFDKNNTSQAQLSESQSKRLLANIEILKKVWFEDRIAQYCDINHPETCEAFMDRQIKLLNDFGNLAFENAQVLYPDKSQNNLKTISDELFADIDKWMLETPFEKKADSLKAIREATVFWLSTEDLGLQVMEARKQLVVRVIGELENGMDLAATTSIVTNERSKRLKENAFLLMEAWIHVLADQYSEMPKDRRTKFVDGKIEEVKKWKILDYLSDDSAKSKNSLAALTQFNQTLKTWTERADESAREKISKLHSAIQQRIFFSLLNPTGNGDTKDQ